MAGAKRSAGRRAGRGGVAEGAHDQDSAPLSACLTHSGLRALAGAPYICINTYCILTYIHTYIHFTYIHAYMHTCIQAYIHICIHTYIHTYIQTYIHIIDTYSYVYVNTISI